MWNTKSILKNLKMKKLFKGGSINIARDDDKVLERIRILIDYAIQNDLVVLVGNQTRIDNYKVENESVEVVGFALNFTKHIANRDMKNGVLFDESVSPEMIRYFRKEYPEIEIRGGFQKGLLQ